MATPPATPPATGSELADTIVDFVKSVLSKATVTATEGYGDAIQTINVFSANPRIVFDKRELGVAMQVFKYGIQWHNHRVGRFDFDTETVNSMLCICE